MGGVLRAGPPKGPPPILLLLRRRWLPLLAAAAVLLFNLRFLFAHAPLHDEPHDFQFNMCLIVSARRPPMYLEASIASLFFQCHPWPRRVLVGVDSDERGLSPELRAIIKSIPVPTEIYYVPGVSV
jgi:hypothetical protein